METKIKICGLRRPEDIAYVNEFLPDYIGFIFFPKSKRYVTNEEAKKLKNFLNPEIKAVGVFVNEEIDKIITLCKDGIIDIIQLHGDENTEYINLLKEKLRELGLEQKISIMKAFRVKGKQDIEAALKLQNQTDYLLLDAYGKEAYGGTGETFRHELIPKDMPPYFLAGGIGVDNVVEIIVKMHPFAVDLSSGVETNGFKDKEKIKKIIEMVRSIKEEEHE
ncbi:MAG: phosphoribosylanthranilate isomerase [Lachnospiraceae bacterium]|nr:phosphoribosylanthranilate isomerase [Lachnospiraceae bacterium]